MKYWRQFDMQYNRYVFSDLENADFDITQYSRLKFGDDDAARKIGYDLANGFFEKHSALLLANQCVIIPSPYNVVENAATIMAKYFMYRLNELLVEANGNHLDWSIIHRKVSYIQDYGFLDKEKRAALINNDDFYMNTEYLEGKLLIFVDDVKITGTHEDKLINIIQKRYIKNKVMFVYYTSYIGNDASVESRLNFAAIEKPSDYVSLVCSHKTRMIIRPMKYLLGQSPDVLKKTLDGLPADAIRDLYLGSLCEGYYRLPTYQISFKMVSDAYKNILNEELI